ncbi:MAG TPA: hypothetical protein VL981_01865 [Candidatus Methylacidiphilales bacterium]|nr:hypothetical protein [Candidatus Methylacidiphilales bacterium]
MNDWIPTLPSLQTWLSIFMSPTSVDTTGSHIAFWISVLWYLAINAMIFMPFIGPSIRVRIILFIVVDLLPVVGLAHFVSGKWDYSMDERQQVITLIEKLKEQPISVDEREYRTSVLWQVMGIYSWSQSAEESSAIRASIFGELPNYFETRDVRRAQLEQDYHEDGSLGWWSYRHGIDELDTELPPGLEDQTHYSPRAERATEYAIFFIVLGVLTLPYHQRFLHLLVPATSPQSIARTEHEKLAKALAAYDRVEMRSGNVTFTAAYKGTFTYESGYVRMGDVRMVVIGGQWVSQGEETGDYLAPSNVTLRFTKRKGTRKSIFEE